MAKKVAVLIPDGCKEIKALTPVDVLRRAGIQCDMVGLDSLDVMGAHQIALKCDKVLDDSLLDYDLVTLPGGMGGATRLRDSEKLQALMVKRAGQGKWNAAMCAAPMALAKYGLLKGHDYTMFPGMHQEHGDAEGRFHEDMVVVDEAARLVTSRGPATAMPYSFKLAEVLGVDTSELREAMLYNFLLDQK